jgi:hypothetical protein
VATWRAVLKTDDLAYSERSQMDVELQRIGGSVRVRTNGSHRELECNAPNAGSARDHLTWVIRRAQMECQWLSEDRVGEVVELPRLTHHKAPRTRPLR